MNQFLKKLPDNQIIFFQSQDGKIHMEVLYAEENIWLNQKTMAKLFTTERIEERKKWG